MLLPELFYLTTARVCIGKSPQICRISVIFWEEIHRKFYAEGMTEMANESNRRLDTGHAKRDFRLRQLIARIAEIPFSYGRAPFPPGTGVPDDSFFAR